MVDDEGLQTGTFTKGGLPDEPRGAERFSTTSVVAEPVWKEVDLRVRDCPPLRLSSTYSSMGLRGFDVTKSMMPMAIFCFHENPQILGNSGTFPLAPNMFWTP